jgi:hypothetical protein
MHLLADKVNVVPGRVQRRMCEHIGHDLDSIPGTDERCCCRVSKDMWRDVLVEAGELPDAVALFADSFQLIRDAANIRLFLELLGNVPLQKLPRRCTFNPRL